MNDDDETTLFPPWLSELRTVGYQLERIAGQQRRRDVAMALKRRGIDLMDGRLRLADGTIG